MSLTVKSLEVILFKGFKAASISFNPGLNLLVGSNNSGKSSLIQALYLAFDFLKLTHGIGEVDKKKGAKKERLRGATVKSISLPFHEESYVSEGLKKRSRRDRTTTIKINTEMNFNVEFMETITFPGGNMLVISSNVDGGAGSKNYRKKIDKLVKQKEKFPIYIPTFAGVANREEAKTVEVTKYYISSGRSSEVLRNQLGLIPATKIALLNKYLRTSFGLEIVSNQTKEIYLSSIYKEAENNLDISSGGSGFQQILHILVYIVTSESDVVLIDEPDAHLHYKLQNTLYEILRSLANDGKQIIVATHSQIFIKRALQYDDRLILVNKALKDQRPASDYDKDLKMFYEEGLIDEKEMTQGGVSNIIGIEDTKTGVGFKVITELLRKLEIQEPKYNFVSTGGHGNDVLKYVRSKQKIENVSLKSLIIRDNDSLPEKYREGIVKAMSKENSKLIYLKAHEIENYLVSPTIIARILTSRKVKTTTQEIDNILIKLVRKTKNRDSLLDCLEASVDGHLKNDDNYKLVGIRYDDIFTKVREIKKEIIDKFMVSPFKSLPGKKLFKLLQAEIKKKFGVLVTELEIAKEFKESEIPEELKGIKVFFEPKN